MLVITRRVGETLTIRVGDSTLMVEVAEVRGSRVRLVFNGPQDFRILRTCIQGDAPDKSERNK